MQIGQEKCLLILGIRLSEIPQERPLAYGDLEPIDLIPMRKSNGEIIYSVLEETIAKTGIPRQIIADHGPDINAGINKFLTIHPETCSTYDIKHKTAAVLKNLLNNNQEWSKFIRECATAKKQLQQTELAFLAPPNQGTKARYMNIDTLIAWGITVGRVLENVSKPNGNNIYIVKTCNKINDKLQLSCIEAKFSRQKCQEKLGWLSKYADILNALNRIMIIVTTIESFIRKNGYTANTVEQLYKELQKCVLCEQSSKIKAILIEFVKSEAVKAKPNETLLGSSEIIESLFGKQKHLSHEQSKSGFTGLIVSIGAFVATTTKEVIVAAMESVKTEDVRQWAKTKIGQTVQSLRNTLRNVDQNIDLQWK